MIEAKKFVSRLCALERSNDKGSMSLLRRFLLTEEVEDFFGAASVIQEWIPERFLRDGRSRFFYIVAGLFSILPENCRSGNMGDSMRIFSQKNSKSTQSMENRMRRLIAADACEIGEELYPLIRMFNNKGVSVNYSQLLTDLLYWDSVDQNVQFRWANSFFPKMRKPKDK